jgi:Zn-finger nucleic acid-binding protein
MTDLPAVQPAPRNAGMLCPVCKVGLLLSDRQGIEIDYCPQCRGVWLDRGELDKIIERSNAFEDGPARETGPGYPPAYEEPGYGGERHGSHGQAGHRSGGHGGGGHGGGHGGSGHGGNRGGGHGGGSFLGRLFDRH